MPSATERILLPANAPGTERSLLVHRFGRAGARPKVYIQAALHADEIPGLLVAQHLLLGLERALEEDRILGEVIVVPVANPIGLAQQMGGRLLGRHDFGNYVNFNREFPDLSGPAMDHLEGRLGADPQANVAAIRSALALALHDQPAVGETESLKRILLGMALDADLVFDLHCDSEALPHVYASTWQADDAAALGADLSARAVLLDLPEGTGGLSFDEACHGPWWKLRERLPGVPVPLACFAVTVEHRGQADVTDPLAASDAASLLRFLQRRGVVQGEPGPIPEPRCAPTALDAVDVLVAPVAGIVVYHREVGDTVAAGDLIAEIVSPLAEPWGAARTPVRCATSGLMFSHAIGRMLRPGQKFCKIAGEVALEYRRKGKLLSD